MWVVLPIFNITAMQGKVPEECWSIPQQKQQHEAKHRSQLHSIRELHDHLWSRGSKVCVNCSSQPRLLVPYFHLFQSNILYISRFLLFGKKYQLKFASDISAETHCLVHFPSFIRFVSILWFVKELTLVIGVLACLVLFMSLPLSGLTMLPKFRMSIFESFHSNVSILVLYFVQYYKLP
jgi:hypothetical protein